MGSMPEVSAINEDKLSWIALMHESRNQRTP